MEGCIFCKIAKGEIDSAKIYEDDKFFAFLDVKPLNPGHSLLIPKKHIDYIFDIDEPLYSEIFKTAKKLSKPIKDAVNSKKIGMAIEGFGVPHTHLHLIPLNNINDIDPHRARQTSSEELNKVAEKIREEILKI